MPTKAIALGRHLRECLQKATQTEDETQPRQLLTVAIVGGGASGADVSLRGTLLKLGLGESVANLNVHL